MTHTASVRAGRAITTTLLIAYGLAVAVVVFWPTPVDRGFDLQLLRFAAMVRANGMLWLTYEHVEFAGNVLLFVPIGIGLTLVLPPALHWLVPLAGLASSAVIELVQAVALPDRFGGPVDVLANTLGAALGWAGALAVRSIVERSRREKLRG